MRLGDYIDDHCSRCKRTTDHSVVSMMGDEVLKTRCRTCDSEHKYRQNKSRSKEMTAKEAFDKLMATAMGAQPEEPAPQKKARKRKGE
jgi:recombinational DNA repair protein (RecF pathway)